MDNDERKERVLELGNQAKLKLEEAVGDYTAFKAACSAVNPKLVQLYADAGLAPPAPKPVEIMTYTEVGHSARASEVAEVMEVLANIGTFVGLTKSMGPAVTKYLKKTQKISASFAEKELISRSITLYEDALSASRGVAGVAEKIEIKVTAGDVAGHVVAGVMAGVAVGVLDGIIWAAEDATLTAHLKDAIKALHPLRTATYLSHARTKAALDSIKATDAMVDALSSLASNAAASALQAGHNAIVTSVEKTIARAASLDSVITQLKQMDVDNASLTSDDPDYQV